MLYYTFIVFKSFHEDTITGETNETPKEEFQTPIGEWCAFHPLTTQRKQPRRERSMSGLRRDFLQCRHISSNATIRRNETLIDMRSSVCCSRNRPCDIPTSLHASFTTTGLPTQGQVSSIVLHITSASLGRHNQQPTWDRHPT